MTKTPQQIRDERLKEKRDIRNVTENMIGKTRTGNPIADTITANKLWRDYLNCVGIKR
jgi:hypothetical protein